MNSKRTIVTCLGIFCLFSLLLIISKGKLMKKANLDTENEQIQDNQISQTGVTYRDYQKSAVMDGISYKILSADMKEELVEEDNNNYYMERGKVEKEVDYWTKPTNSEVIYRQELTYVTVNLQIKNESSEQKIFQDSDFRIYNIENEKMEEFFDFCDYRVKVDDGNEMDWDFVLDSRECILLEFVYVTFLPSSYNLYFVMPKQINNGNSYLCLSLQLIQMEKRERDLAKLKQYGSSNYDIASASEESNVLKRYFYESDQTVGPFAEVKEMGEIYDSKKYTIIEAKLENNYDKLPESFKQREYISEMKKVYQQRYGFEESGLQYLVLTVKLEQFQNIQKTIPIKPSQILWIYNRTAENRIVPVGYPDDYEVSDEVEGGYEHIDTYEDGTNDIHYIRAVYIIWPGALQDIYLWTNNGCIREGNENSYAKENAAGREMGGGIHVEVS